MPSRKDRIIIDTNLWVSFLLTKDIAKLDKLITLQEITFVISQELIDELVEVTQRTKFRKYFPLDDVEDLILHIRSRGVLIRTTSIVDDCRDPKDNFLLSLALDGKATHLITGDKDLLVMKQYGKTAIVTINEYLNQQ